MSFLTLNYPNSFLIRKIREGKFSTKASLVDVLEEFIIENNSGSDISNTKILKQYYTNIALKFYAQVYSLASKGETSREAFLRDNSIFFFMHDFLAHIFYGHTIDVIGDQRVHEAKNSLTVQYNSLEIIVKFFINREFFKYYLQQKGFALSDSLCLHLESFHDEYERIVDEYSEAELLNVFVKSLLAHLDERQDLLAEIHLIASVISHEQNLRRICIYQLFDGIQTLLEGVSDEVIEVTSITSKFNSAYERITEMVDQLDFTALDLDLSEVLVLYNIDKVEYERKRAKVEDELFNILISKSFVSKINRRLSFFDIAVQIPYIKVSYYRHPEASRA